MSRAVLLLLLACSTNEKSEPSGEVTTPDDSASPTDGSDGASDGSDGALQTAIWSRPVRRCSSTRRLL